MAKDADHPPPIRADGVPGFAALKMPPPEASYLTSCAATVQVRARRPLRLRVIHRLGCDLRSIAPIPCRRPRARFQMLAERGAPSAKLRWEKRSEDSFRRCPGNAPAKDSRG